MMNEFFEWFLRPDVISCFLVVSFLVSMWAVCAGELIKERKKRRDGERRRKEIDRFS